MITAVSSACSREQAEPSWIGELGYSPAEVAPLHIGLYGYPFVDLAINGSLHRLALDTGNMTGLLLSPEVAKTLNLPAIDTSRQFDSAGKVVATADVFHIETLEAFGSVWHDQKAHEFELTGVSGLIGPKYLLGGRFTLDYLGGMMAVSGTPTPGISSAIALPMIRSPDHEALILVGGWVNSEWTTVEIDTGKSRTVVDTAMVQKLAMPETPDGFRVDDIRLGSFRYSASSAKEKSFAGISHGLEVPIGLGVGSDILSKVILTVDYRAGVVLLLPR